MRIAASEMDRPAPIELAPKLKISPVGFWSALTMWMFIGLVAFQYHGFEQLSDFPLLWKNPTALENTGYAYLTIITACFLILPISIALAIAVEQLLGKSSGHEIANDIAKGKKDYFGIHLLVVVIEELFARWFCLGFIYGMLPPNNITLYVLFLVGNGYWAWIHLHNYTEKKDRNILRVLPQFFCGICLTYVYLKHGLFASITAHLLFNGVLFALHKRQDIIWNVFRGIYFGLAVYFIHSAMTKDISTLIVWVQDYDSLAKPFKIEGWNFTDYLLAGLLIGAVCNLLCNIFLLDEPYVGSHEDKKFTMSQVFFGIVVGLTIYVCFLYMVYYFTGWFLSSFMYRAAAVTLILYSFRSGPSVGIVPTILLSTPAAYYSVCLVETIGFWQSVLYLGCQTIFFLVPNAMTEKHP